MSWMLRDPGQGPAMLPPIMQTQLEMSKSPWLLVLTASCFCVVVHLSSQAQILHHIIFRKPTCKGGKGEDSLDSKISSKKMEKP